MSGKCFDLFTLVSLRKTRALFYLFIYFTIFIYSPSSSLVLRKELAVSVIDLVAGVPASLLESVEESLGLEGEYPALSIGAERWVLLVLEEEADLRRVEPLEGRGLGLAELLARGVEVERGLGGGERGLVVVVAVVVVVWRSFCRGDTPSPGL